MFVLPSSEDLVQILCYPYQRTGLMHCLTRGLHVPHQDLTSASPYLRPMHYLTGEFITILPEVPRWCHHRTSFNYLIGGFTIEYLQMDANQLSTYQYSFMVATPTSWAHCPALKDPLPESPTPASMSLEWTATGYPVLWGLESAS